VSDSTGLLIHGARWREGRALVGVWRDIALDPTEVAAKFLLNEQSINAI
jgi:hypothetical protein